MSKEIYIGVGDKAKKITDFYIGVNGQTKKVIKAYIGVNGQAKEFYSYKKNHIYGVVSTTTSKMTRTDDAKSFVDPSPAVGTGTGSSPFDSLMPWSGMVVETIGKNTLVKIPKYWYKWSIDNGKLALRISDGPDDGFYVSPAHADRGDGTGERDYVYIGRYKSTGDNYYSVSGGDVYNANIDGSTPQPVTERTKIQSFGTGYYVQDYAMFWTVRMLYLVEFANWDPQELIGIGTRGQKIEKTGLADNLKYHTGTIKTNKIEVGAGVQYRYIQDLWAATDEWIDGIILDYKIKNGNYPAIKINKNPKNHSNLTSYTTIGYYPIESQGGIYAYTIPSVSGFQWAIFPSSTSQYDGLNQCYVPNYAWQGKDSGTSYFTTNYVSTGTNAINDVYVNKVYGLFSFDPDNDPFFAGRVRIMYLP